MSSSIKNEEKKLEYYFAYGSNMNRKRMTSRCKEYEFRILKKAMLEGFRFVFDSYPVLRNDAVANVIPAPGNIVWGALIEVDEGCIKELDKYEGVASGIYVRRRAKVKDEDGNAIEAWIYLREPKEKGTPSREYLALIIEGAEELHLPIEYIQSIKNAAAMQ